MGYALHLVIITKSLVKHQPRWMGLMGHRSLKLYYLEIRNLASLQDKTVPPWCCTNGKLPGSSPPVELLPLWLLRPWLHCFSLQSHITKADCEKHSWSSDGNTKVKTAHGKVVCVYLDSKRINNWDVDSVLITWCIFHSVCGIGCD